MDINHDVIKNFWSKRAAMEDETASRLGDDVRINYDFSLICQYIDENSTVLDLGCGNCGLTNKLEPIVKSIVAVDKFDGFLKYCKKSPKISTVVSDVLEFYSDNRFDVILIFGVLNYVTREQALSVYERCKDMLSSDGIMIIKHQMGVSEDVVVNSFSEALNQNYSASYRHVKQEVIDMEKAGFDVEVVDIYPRKLNKWDNTHHYACICKKKNYL